MAIARVSGNKEHGHRLFYVYFMGKRFIVIFLLLTGRSRNLHCYKKPQGKLHFFMPEMREKMK